MNGPAPTPPTRADARREAQRLLRDLDALPPEQARDADGLRRSLRALVGRCAVATPPRLDFAEHETLVRLRREVAAATLGHAAPLRTWLARLAETPPSEATDPRTHAAPPQATPTPSGRR